ncbi:unnamed protein product [Bursaphelenchus okinawaensis]|uniref:Neurotransmitter-gated ion-channel ligand-binding domain-containing protein n=1 Tax=Bursaphelenchus okinawaensis TaxID=465554 RepID=A0A811L344_9BILA|nr:unnamed protein product [Bursaphelenchus okinawaensis]CAG9115193.1 unnamed protein product [Bursaphelenchus okinawaensis]
MMAAEESGIKPAGLSFRTKHGDIISFLNLKAHFTSPDTVTDEDDSYEEDMDFYDQGQPFSYKDGKDKKTKYRFDAYIKQIRKRPGYDSDTRTSSEVKFDKELDEEMAEEDFDDNFEEDISIKILEDDEGGAFAEDSDELTEVELEDENYVDSGNGTMTKSKVKGRKGSKSRKKWKIKQEKEKMEKMKVDQKTTTTEIIPTNVTSNMSLIEELEEEMMTTTVNPEDDRIMSFFGMFFEESEEEEGREALNETVVKEHWVLAAEEILHTDSLGRSEEELREMLTEPEHLEQTFGQAHRDHGASYLLPILKTVQYDNNSVPVVFPDIPVHVRVALNVIQLGNFDSQNMEYSIDLEMHMTWYDVRLANNYSKPIRIREKEILDLVWRPDPYFVNSKYSYFHIVSFPNFRMRVMPTGLVFYTLRATLLPVCLMTFCRHPHDHQQCDLKISSIAYPRSFVSFSWHSNAVEYNSKVTLPELRIKSLDTETCKVEGKLVASSCLRLKISLERDGARYIVEKYIPSTLAMMFAWVAPYVPYNYEDVRIITPITVLLTLVQMEKGDAEVHTSYLTSMDIWFVAMKTFSVLSLVESLIVLALIKQSRGMKKEMIRAPNEYEREKFKVQKRRLTQLYHRLDATARFLSPIAFLFFFVYYVLYVTQRDEKTCLGQSIFDLP